MYERSVHAAAVFGLRVDQTTLDQDGSAAPAEAQRGHLLWLIPSVCLWCLRCCSLRIPRKELDYSYIRSEVQATISAFVCKRWHVFTFNGFNCSQDKEDDKNIVGGVSHENLNMNF